MEKKDRYELLCKQVESLAAGETNVVGVLANASAAMKTMFPEEFFWVGFYIVASPPALPCREGASQAHYLQTELVRIKELSKWLERIFLKVKQLI